MNITNEEIKIEFKRQVKLCQEIGKIEMLNIINDFFPPSEEKKEEAKQFNPALDLMIKPGQCKYCGRSDK